MVAYYYRDATDMLSPPKKRVFCGRSSRGQLPTPAPFKRLLKHRVYDAR